MKRLADSQMPLTVCPLSNVKLCAVSSMQAHPIKKLMDAGVLVTINSDDPAYFGGYINDNFTQTFAATGLQAHHAYTLARNSFLGSFLDDDAKARHLAEIDRVAREYAA